LATKKVYLRDGKGERQLNTGVYLKMKDLIVDTFEVKHEHHLVDDFSQSIFICEHSQSWQQAQ
jgi:hypothetical protein